MKHPAQTAVASDALGMNLPSGLYLDVLDDVSEDRGTLTPGPQQLHGLVKVQDVVGVHPQEGRVLKQDTTQAWALTPRFVGSGKVHHT